jgi:hypothetical protein
MELCGFEKVRLDGNIGYINIPDFLKRNQSAQQILDATMSFISNTNALVLI